MRVPLREKEDTQGGVLIFLPPFVFFLGDVSPVHMNPILQSQFVPLAEVLCCAISDMNAAHLAVTQETLLDQLGKHYPGNVFHCRLLMPRISILFGKFGSRATGHELSGNWKAVVILHSHGKIKWRI